MRLNDDSGAQPTEASTLAIALPVSRLTKFDQILIEYITIKYH